MAPKHRSSAVGLVPAPPRPHPAGRRSHGIAGGFMCLLFVLAFLVPGDSPRSGTVDAAANPQASTADGGSRWTKDLHASSPHAARGGERETPPAPGPSVRPTPSTSPSTAAEDETADPPTDQGADQATPDQQAAPADQVAPDTGETDQPSRERGERPAAPAQPSTPAPAPDTTPTRTSPPSRAGFPDESTTGPRAGHALRPSGSLTITEDGATVSDLDIDGCIDVKARNVTVSDVRISCERTTTAIRIHDGASATIQYTEIDGNGVVSTAVGFSNYTLSHVNIHNVIDGPRMNFNVSVLDSYIHGLKRTGDSHNDALQTTGGEGIVVRGNTLIAYDESRRDPLNACIMIGSENAPLRDMVIENNYLDGGNYSILTRADIDARNVRVTGNVFGPNARYGPYRGVGAMDADHSNVFAATGDPIF